jgi:hypothetical protein
MIAFVCKNPFVMAGAIYPIAIARNNRASPPGRDSPGRSTRISGFMEFDSV